MLISVGLSLQRPGFCADDPPSSAIHLVPADAALKAGLVLRPHKSGHSGRATCQIYASTGRFFTLLSHAECASCQGAATGLHSLICLLHAVLAAAALPENAIPTVLSVGKRRLVSFLSCR